MSKHFVTIETPTGVIKSGIIEVKNSIENLEAHFVKDLGFKFEHSEVETTHQRREN